MISSDVGARIGRAVDATVAADDVRLPARAFAERENSDRNGAARRRKEGEKGAGGIEKETVSGECGTKGEGDG